MKKPKRKKSLVGWTDIRNFRFKLLYFDASGIAHINFIFAPTCCKRDYPKMVEWKGYLKKVRITIEEL